MRAFPGFDRQKARGFVSALCCGLLAASLALASGAYAAGGGGSGGGGGGGGAGSGGGALNQAEPRAELPSDLTVCKPGQVWDTKRRKCLVRRSDVLPDPEMTEYAYQPVDEVPVFQFRVGSAATMTIAASSPSTVAIRAKTSAASVLRTMIRAYRVSAASLGVP